jgi:hypothetical protein
MIPKDLIFYAKYLKKNTCLIHNMILLNFFFIYNQKPSPGLVYIRIDNPDDSANLPGCREIKKFYKEEKQRGVKPHFHEHRARTH